MLTGSSDTIDSNNHNEHLETGSNSNDSGINEERQLNKNLLKEIESINPDHEQRKLAIEVIKFFFK